MSSYIVTWKWASPYAQGSSAVKVNYVQADSAERAEHIVRSERAPALIVVLRTQVEA